MSPRAHAYWSLRRELWENRSIYIAPLAVAGLALFASSVNTSRGPEKLGALGALDPATRVVVAVTPYSLAASVILMTCLLVGFFYCLDALNSERRDRSILFWKSMPVSDVTTVLSKASIPLVVLPLLGCAVVLVTQLAMLLFSTAVMLAKGFAPLTLWEALPLAQMPVAMIYGTAVHALWFAPIHAWLLLVSAWARRAMFLWAFLPFVAAIAVEALAFGTTHVGSVLKYRLMGAMELAFAPNALKQPITHLSQLTPMTFLGSPGLWAGLAVAAALLAAAIRLRRYREPI